MSKLSVLIFLVQKGLNIAKQSYFVFTKKLGVKTKTMIRPLLYVSCFTKTL